MENPLERRATEIYTVLRIVIGLLFACHGAQKLLGWFGGFGGQPGATAPLGTLMGFAGAVELIAGLLIAIGLLTVPAAFLASGEMAVAYWKAHAPEGPWPILNHGELAVVYAFLFLYIAARGPGPWSADAYARRTALPRDRTLPV